MYGFSAFGTSPYGYGDDNIWSPKLADSVQFGSTPAIAEWVLLLTDSAGFADAITVTYNVYESVLDAVHISDAAAQRLKESWSDSMALASAPGSYALIAKIVAEVFDLSVIADQTVQAQVKVALALAIHDTLHGGPIGKLADAMGVAQSVAATALHIAKLLDAFAAAAATSGHATLFAIVPDTVALADANNYTLRIAQLLQDALEVGITLYTGQDGYTAWVMTPETRAMRSYTNFPFNSYAISSANGNLYGAAADGVYRLSGATDNGTAIYSSVRSGLLDFKSRQLKSMDTAYIGYVAGGVLCLRVSTTSLNGEKETYTYKMVPATAGAPREGRFKIGRGLQSVYWQFELDNNLNGASFELHDMSVIPMILTRRVR